jgi:sulfate adenylyltransferase subunit 2
MTLHDLESEAVYMLRESVADTRHPVLMYSVAEHSSVLVHLALKASFPGPIPFPLLHVDTGW